KVSKTVFQQLRGEQTKLDRCCRRPRLLVRISLSEILTKKIFLCALCALESASSGRARDNN
ncbi:MAG: hypothetical protein V2B13_13750, partial [Pseudomonadota bacterium]